MAKKLALVFGVVFILIGLLGFVSNPLVGMGALFEADMMHNLAHIMLGLILLLVALKAAGKSALWLKIIGVVYLVLAILGFLMVPDGGTLLGLVETNTADHWLHLVLGVVLVGVGFLGKGGAPEGSTA